VKLFDALQQARTVPVLTVLGLRAAARPAVGANVKKRFKHEIGDSLRPDSR
jgi:hypothetical protein